ncbi:MAG: CCA tRNA nucleotidyltransferase [Solirubrobacteraceae bacterium]|nr:CCA tRNA nucleotidyltransferase [Solirubrobacteraceae bacterium]
MRVLERVADVPGLRALRELAARRPEPLWLVGGTVRDALLGRAPRDLDVAVEGDALAVARALGEVVAEHARFGTAEVRVDRAKVNLAAARTETYPSPGALPEVRLGATIEADLRRRDFTVNAIAVGLRDGREVAFPGALEDLERRRLRVLHDASFLDDPTRLYRMVRYERRLGLAIEPRTAALARAAQEGGALYTLTRDRIAAELRLMLDEPDPVGTIAAVRAWGGRAAPAVDEELARAALELLDGEGRLELVLVGSGCAGDERAAARDIQWFDDSRPARRRAREVARAPQLAEALRAARRPSEIAAAAVRRPLEAVALAGALGAREPAQRWLRELRHVRLAIDGRDVMAAGVPEGPQVRAALERALAARLDGEIPPGRDAELAAALAAD